MSPNTLAFNKLVFKIKTRGATLSQSHISNVAKNIPSPSV